MRLLYTVCFYLALPLVFVRLLLRARAAPAYRERWRERFGFNPVVSGKRRDLTKSAIWVHSVSVGETLAAVPMIKALQIKYPQYELIVTTMTPTGSERVQDVFADSVVHVYAPYDLPDCVSRFLRNMQPQIAIIMETELWPNILRGCAKNSVPVVVANARLSEKSAKGYRKFTRLSAAMMSWIATVAAQTQEDARRFESIGATPARINVTGNIKFDLTINESMQQQASVYRHRWQGEHGSRSVLLVASTHEGEDELALQAYALLRATLSAKNPLLVLIPRHPERFSLVANMAAERFSVRRHSEFKLEANGTTLLAEDVEVVVGDTMGEMMAMLGACDVCFMGGSWVPKGGHNMIEAAAWGKPIFTGSSLYNFAEASALLLAADAMKITDTPSELAEQVALLFNDVTAAARMGLAAQQVAENNKGALERLLGVIDGYLKPSH